MSKRLVYVKKKADINLDPDSTISGGLVVGGNTVFLSGKIVIELTQDSLFGLGVELLNWATTEIMLDVVDEGKPISATLGAIPVCGTYLHPDSNALVVFVAEPFAEVKTPPLAPASSDSMAIDPAPDFELALGLPSNVIKVYAIDESGRRLEPAAWIKLFYSPVGMIGFASTLIRLSKETFLENREISGDELGARLTPDSMPIVLRLTKFPSVEDLLRQVGFKRYE